MLRRWPGPNEKKISSKAVEKEKEDDDDAKPKKKRLPVPSREALVALMSELNFLLRVGDPWISFFLLLKKKSYFLYWDQQDL